MHNSKGPASSVAVSVEKELPALANRPASVGWRQRIRQICIHLWIWELLSLLVCVTCVGTIIIILLRYDDRPLPNWGFGLTINGVISVLAGIAKASMILPVAECISQLKWHWFWNASARPLMDFQFFDAASRGPWGCLVLLFRPRQWSTSSVGAMITVAALLMEPSLQFIPSYPSRLVVKENASLERSLEFKDYTTTTAINSYMLNETSSKLRNLIIITTSFLLISSSVEVYDAGPSLNFAFYNALFGLGNDTVSTTPTCPTGNCTWPTYSSLAVCNACTNLTSKVFRKTPRVERGWWLENGMWLNDNEYFHLASTEHPMVYDQTVNQSILTVNMLHHDVPADASKIKPEAAECVLYFCVKESLASVAAGVFKEKTISVWPGPNELVPHAPNFFIPYLNISTAPSDFKIREVVLRPPGKEESFHVDSFTLYWAKRWMQMMVSWELSSFATWNNSPGSSGGPNGELSPDGATGDLPRAMFERLKMHKDAEEGPIKAVMDRFANALTAAIRTKATKNLRVEGTAQGVETFVKARWGWAILPVTLVGLTCLFIVATLALTIKHNVPVWKSSALATLAHGLDEASGALVTADKLDEIERKSEAYRMVMRGDDHPRKLRVSDAGCCS